MIDTTSSGVMSYFAKIGLNVDEFMGGLSKSQGGLLAFYRDVTVTMNMTMMIFDRFMAYGQKFVDLANQASEYNHQMERLSVTTGISVDDMQRWNKVAKMAEMDVETLSMTISRLQVNLKDAGKEGSTTSNYLEALGVSVYEANGSFRNSSDVFTEIVNKLREMNDVTLRNQITQDLFGRGFQQLAPIFMLTKEQMEGYFNTASVMTEKQRSDLERYETTVKMLDSSVATLSRTAGSELAPAFTEWTELLDDSLEDGAPLLEFFGYLNDFLSMAARGFHIMGAEAMIAYKIVFKRDFEGAKTDQVDLLKWIGAKTRDDAMRAAGYDTDGMGNVIIKSDKIGTDIIVSTEGEKEKGVLTSDEIRDKNLQLRELTNITLPDLTKKLKEARITGIKTDIEAADIALQKATNSANDLKVALGQAVAATTATLTYNQQFASSLQAGGIGPDLAGYSDLANMSMEDLIKAAGGDFALTGGSQGMKDKAQTYLDLMKAGGTTGAVGKTTISPAVSKEAANTEALTTELDKQKAVYLASWMTIEADGLVHYTAMSEMARIEYQKLMDDWDISARHITETIAYNQVITVTDGVPAAVPMKFEGVAATVLKAIDLSSVKLSQAEDKGKGTAGTTINQVVNINNPKGTPAEVEAANKAANRQLATKLQTGGL